MFEVLDTNPAVAVSEAEYRRLLGYPKNHQPGDRALELGARSRSFYAVHGRPWVYVREVDLVLGADRLVIAGVEFKSSRLHRHLLDAGAKRIVLLAVSAGASCEERAHELWQEAKPDEYFFLEIFGSAVVEHLVYTSSGRICDLAERDGLVAVPHYSPGYTGWDVADQVKLFDLIKDGRTQPLPEAFEVLSSGMLRPKKSLIAVVGLAQRPVNGAGPGHFVPCHACALAPCQYRRGPYKFAPSQVESVTPPMIATTVAPSVLSRNASYSVAERALQKWSRERVKFEQQAEGSLLAVFRFDGTTCSNQGRPLAFDYRVKLSPADEGYTILEAECVPASGDEGHRAMCAYLNNAVELMNAISAEKPLLGQSLESVLSWTRGSAPSGCYCDALSRTHKWGLALEAIHYALAQNAPVS